MSVFLALWMLHLFQCAGRCWNRSTFCVPTFEGSVIWICSNQWGIRPKRELCENLRNAVKICLVNELITAGDTNNILFWWTFIAFHGTTFHDCDRHRTTNSYATIVCFSKWKSLKNLIQFPALIPSIMENDGKISWNFFEFCLCYRKYQYKHG